MNEEQSFQTPKAFCPHCGVDISKKLLYKKEKILSQSLRYFSTLKKMSEKPGTDLLMGAKDKKEYDEYFAGKMVTNTSLICSGATGCHTHIELTINNLTGEMTGYDTELKPEFIKPKIVEEVVEKNEHIELPNPEAEKTQQQQEEIEKWEVYISHYPGSPKILSH